MKPLSSATPINLPLRFWFGVEVLFGIAAIGAVFLQPEATATNFAWAIKPTVMAATFGGFYVSVSLLFILGLFAQRWQQVRVICIPAAVFTAFLLLTTFLHWDKFSVGNLPFYVWFASYLLPPPIFIGLYLWHQNKSLSVATGRTQLITLSTRRFWIFNGFALMVLALFFYCFPNLLIAIAPWKFTFLTARTLCGWLIGVGLLQTWMAWEGDWQRVKIATTTLMLLPFALLFQLIRFQPEVQWNNIPLWLLLLDFIVAAILCIRLWLKFEWRTRQQRLL
jgi:hypothetical protein